MQSVYVSPVITYLPVSPVAPPKSITLDLDTYVIVCPNLANGTSPKVSTFVTLLLLLFEAAAVDCILLFLF